MGREVPDRVRPHPGAHLRGVGHAARAEVAPGWAQPRLGHTGEALLAALPPQIAAPMTF